jgi:hypothetical protein
MDCPARMDNGDAPGFAPPPRRFHGHHAPPFRARRVHGLPHAHLRACGALSRRAQQPLAGALPIRPGGLPEGEDRARPVAHRDRAADGLWRRQCLHPGFRGGPRPRRRARRGGRHARHAGGRARAPARGRRPWRALLHAEGRRHPLGEAARDGPEGRPARLAPAAPVRRRRDAGARGADPRRCPARSSSTMSAASTTPCRPRRRRSGR